MLLGLVTVLPQAPAQAAGNVYGPYFLMNWNSVTGAAQCLADPGASTGNNVQQILWNCGSSGQKFSNETAVTNTDYWTFNYANGKCLAPQFSSYGAAIVQTGCTTATTGRWAYDKVRDSSNPICVTFPSTGVQHCTTLAFRIRNLNSGMCIASQLDQVTAGTKLVQYYCDDRYTNVWLQFAA
ncbi:RICIN domain-containing protein [Dactylosporangium sp. NPDC051541]|uniref:RICIN domain-containing protein n=1 Tax=Dactylosporangium sp. NPDC051541 TaxID=3363977 RepID=UPI0037BDC30A